MKNHPRKKVKLLHRLILILSIYLTACTAYHVFSASRHTSLSPSQKFDDQLDIPDFNFNRCPSPSPCPSFMSINTHNPSLFPLNSPPFMSLSSSSPSPFPLNSLCFSPSSRNLSHGIVADSVKKKWFEAVTKDDLPTLRHILSNYIFDADEVSPKGNTAFLIACERQNKKIASYLLNIGVNKFMQNNEGWTAFHVACMHGHKALAAWLLTLGLSKYTLDYQGNNALDLVHLYGYHAKQEMCNYLLSIGLQTREVRQKSQLQSFNLSHINLFSPVERATTHQQVMSASIHENPANEEESEDITTATLVPIAMSKRSKKKFPCKYCPRGYTQKRNLTSHLFFHTDPKSVTCPICKEIKSSKASLAIHLSMHKEDKPYGCPYCDRRFRIRSSLNIHVRTHNSEKPYECEECHKRFKTKYYLTGHIKGVHKQERLFKCTICPKAFKRQTHLTRHVKKVHAIKSKVHACKDCTEKFATVHELKRHQRIHTGEATHICPTCSKSFTYVGNMHAHQRTMHPEEKHYVCQDCDEKFDLPSELKRHQRTHTGGAKHTCPTCNKSFTYASNMHTHQRTIHPEEKYYVCQDCDEKFDLPSELKRHRRIHTGKACNICPTCEKSFTSQGNLTAHIHKYHST